MFHERATLVANDFFRSIIGRFRKDNTKRSFSTSDLADNYVEMDFTQPTTSVLPAHFDDCDLVPMKFSSSARPSLLSQHDRRAQQLLRYGSKPDYNIASIADYNRAQVWFYHGMDSTKAERLLRGAGCEEGSFVITEQSTRYVLSFVHCASINHIRIGYSVKGGEAQFRLDIDRSFKDLHSLVMYYTRHKAFVLPMKLKRGVGRPLRVTQTRTRA
ncbi:SH2 domain protein [Dictyocaulus viviparus]|uniref:SH2 domain protein n=1 Tax=Dictyocaulus viviparus TaxID=29172 RepID=A0A0D8Y2D0_DICVI|nr:SH2 domain protein [Dictyocaulus viviparus]